MREDLLDLRLAEQRASCREPLAQALRGRGARSTWPCRPGRPVAAEISAKPRSKASLSATTVACAGGSSARQRPSSRRVSADGRAATGSPSRAARSSSTQRLRAARELRLREVLARVDDEPVQPGRELPTRRGTGARGRRASRASPAPRRARPRDRAAGAARASRRAARAVRRARRAPSRRRASRASPRSGRRASRRRAAPSDRRLLDAIGRGWARGRLHGRRTLVPDAGAARRDPRPRPCCRGSAAASAGRTTTPPRPPRRS